MKEKYKLEEEIRSFIYNDNKNSTHFEYLELDDGNLEVKIITVNKNHDVHFTLVTAVGLNYVDALQLARNKIFKMSEFQTFTIKWYKKNVPASRPIKSKFKAIDITSAIDKFYLDSNKEDLIIYSIVNDNIKSKNYEG